MSATASSATPTRMATTSCLTDSASRCRRFEVEIADDIFIFRKEDARAPQGATAPRLLRISPSTPHLMPGGEVVFKAECTDQYGVPFDIDGAAWSAPEGADRLVRPAACGRLPRCLRGDRQAGDWKLKLRLPLRLLLLPPPPPGDRFVSWEGDVPAQKWTQFYMKVLAGSATDEISSCTCQSGCPRPLSRPNRNSTRQGRRCETLGLMTMPSLPTSRATSRVVGVRFNVLELGGGT